MWKMEIDTKRRDAEGAVSFTVDNPFYLIFNPWCRGKLLIEQFLL
jgi:hypothetical protein